MSQRKNLNKQSYKEGENICRNCENNKNLPIVRS